MDEKKIGNWKKERIMSSDAPMYIYATEGVSSYYSLLGIKNKTVLTACSSGDQILNAYFLGARKVVGFDINKNAQFMAQLKIAAITELSYGEFLRFFGNNKINVGFDHLLYKKLKKRLDRESTNFFDKLYYNFNLDGGRLASSENFRQRNNFAGDSVKLVNAYLKNERAYLILRELLQSVRFKFVECAVSDLAACDKLRGEKFDIINLSNIPGYITRGLDLGGSADSSKELINQIISPLFKIVSPQGLVFYFCHSSRIFSKEKAYLQPSSDKDQNLKRQEFKKNWNIIHRRFAGISPGTRDKIVIFKRK